MKHLIPVALLVLTACSSGPARDKAPTPAAAPAMAVRFVSDDYAGALAQARERKVPLFIEAWAPW